MRLLKASHIGFVFSARWHLADGGKMSTIISEQVYIDIGLGKEPTPPQPGATRYSATRELLFDTPSGRMEDGYITDYWNTHYALDAREILLDASKATGTLPDISGTWPDEGVTLERGTKV